MVQLCVIWMRWKNRKQKAVKQKVSVIFVSGVTECVFVVNSRGYVSNITVNKSQYSLFCLHVVRHVSRCVGCWRYQLPTRLLVWDWTQMMKMMEQKKGTVYGRIIVGGEHKETKMSEIKLAPEEQTRVSLYICDAFILSLFLDLSISVTICFSLISQLSLSLSLLTHSPYPFSTQQWDKKWPAL